MTKRRASDADRWMRENHPELAASFSAPNRGVTEGEVSVPIGPWSEGDLSDLRYAVDRAEQAERIERESRSAGRNMEIPRPRGPGRVKALCAPTEEQWAERAEGRTCTNCGEPLRPRSNAQGRCNSCYRYWSRTGTERPQRGQA